MPLKPKIAEQLETRSREGEWRQINSEFCSWFPFQGITLWFDTLGYWNLWKLSWAVSHPHCERLQSTSAFEAPWIQDNGGWRGPQTCWGSHFQRHLGRVPFYINTYLNIQGKKGKKNHPMLYKTTSFSIGKIKGFLIYLFIGKCL